MATNQLTLQFEPGLVDRHSSLLQCMHSRVYNRGLSNVARSLGKSAGNLARELEEGDDQRHFSIESLERYIEAEGDFTPIFYLIEKFLGDQADMDGAALSRVQDQLSDMAALLAQMAQSKGLKVSKRTR